MAADSDHEADVFEITDFTTASEWERFVSRVEEVLNDWKLTDNPAEVEAHLCWGVPRTRSSYRL
uniref:RAB3 GTPase activating protein subunit 1 n=1 Tax=Oryzias latipes TaxID=8090 RepID=A0A3P9HWY9_ORYLA